jgi:hypothetical protein
LRIAEIQGKFEELQNQYHAELNEKLRELLEERVSLERAASNLEFNVSVALGHECQACIQKKNEK